MKEKLKELKIFRSNLYPENIDQFVSLIESIKEEISEPYKSKLNMLDLYSSYTDKRDGYDDDWPF